MSAAVSITREDYTAAELRREAKRTDDADVSRRMLALALVLEGKSRGEAAISCGMDRQVLCDWVHRYNAEGVKGRECGVYASASKSTCNDYGKQGPGHQRTAPRPAFPRSPRMKLG